MAVIDDDGVVHLHAVAPGPATTGLQYYTLCRYLQWWFDWTAHSVQPPVFPAERYRDYNIPVTCVTCAAVPDE